jgi:hypothetical protein
MVTKELLDRTQPATKDNIDLLLEEMEVQPEYRTTAMEYALKYSWGFRDFFDAEEVLTLGDLADRISPFVDGLRASKTGVVAVS